jgi:hypothetical protein
MHRGSYERARRAIQNLRILLSFFVFLFLPQSSERPIKQHHTQNPTALHFPIPSFLFAYYFFFCLYPACEFRIDTASCAVEHTSLVSNP